jgi:signal transduction histidine kinase
MSAARQAPPSSRPGARTDLRRLESGARPRYLPPEPADGGVEALLAIRELLGEGASLDSLFPALAESMRRVAPFSAIGLALRDSRDEGVPLVSCASGDPAEAERALAIVTAAQAYFDGDASLDRYAELTARAGERWIVLPLIGDLNAIVGLLAVGLRGVPGRVGERTLAFVACVARDVAHRIAENDVLARERSARSAAESKLGMSELTDLALSSFDREKMLRDLSRVLAGCMADGCVIDLASGRRDAALRITHAPYHSGAALARALDPLAARVVAKGRTAVASSRPPDHRAERARAILGVDWLVCAPIPGSRDVVLGAITLIGSLAHHAPPATEFVEALAARVGAAMENTRVFNEAVAAKRTREDVLAMVSHDLMNPLGVIMMTASHLLDANPPVDRRREGRGEIEVIQRNARRMKHLIADLLDFAAMDAGVISMRPAPCDPGAIVREAVADAREAAANAGIDLVSTVAGPLPCVNVDRDRINQVLTNLIGNAIKFTPPGGRIDVRGSAADGEVLFEIADTGPGIGPEQLSRVFERFWQARAITRQGWGLGLAICKSIVVLSGGRIDVRSVVGRGTTFSFTLPVAPATRADL